MHLHPRHKVALTGALIATLSGLGAGLVTVDARQAARTAQVPSSTTRYRAPRAGDGHADLNGIWQAMNTANWDIQDHAARQGPVVALGASFSVPGGAGVVDGNEMPYQPWAAQKKKENAANWLTLDPEVKCYLPGVPRATYMPYPFQIVQSQNTILMAYEFASASRIVHMKDVGEAPIDSWMGWSRGRWDGDTLVVDVTGFNDADVVRSRRQLPQRRAARRRALHADRPRPRAVRSDDRGSEGLHAAVEDEHAALPANREERAALRVQVRRVRRRADVRTPAQEVIVGSASAGLPSHRGVAVPLPSSQLPRRCFSS